MWDSILGAWLKVRSGLTKTDPTNSAEILRQPLFGNPSILNVNGSPFGISRLREGNAFVHSGCSRVKGLRNVASKEWKSLIEMSMSHHPTNKDSLARITASIPWNPEELNNRVQAGDWISKPDPNMLTSPDWIYYVLESHRGTAKVIEFKKITPNGIIKATTHAAITLPTKGYRPVRILSQDKHSSTLKVARDAPIPSKSPLTFWIFKTGFIQELPWDPGEWHWQATPPLGDSPFFEYTAKRGYRNAQTSTHTPAMNTFIQELNLSNSMTTQVTARIWHNSRLRKVGTLIWITLSQGLIVGTWLQHMGILPHCKVCDCNVEESPKHCLLECHRALKAWEAYKRVWDNWEAPVELDINWPFVLLGEPVLEKKDDPPGYLATPVASPTQDSPWTSS